MLYSAAHSASSLGLWIQSTNKRLCTYDGKPLPVVGQTMARLEFNDKCWNQHFVLVETPHSFGLLGRDVLGAPSTDFCGQVLESLPTIRGFVASVRLDPSSNDKFCAPRTVPLHLQGEGARRTPTPSLPRYNYTVSI